MNVETASGRRIYFRLFGMQGKPVCVLLHGLSEGAYVWDTFANQIAHAFQVYAFDLPGHGNSDWYPDGKYTLARYVEDLIYVLDLLALSDVVLIGHSLGGSIAVQIAAHNRRIAKSLVLVDAGPGIEEQNKQFLLDQVMMNFKTYSTVDEYARRLRDQRPLPDDNVIQAMASASLKANVDGGLILKCDPNVCGVLTDENEDDCWGAILKNVLVPTLIIRGEASAMLRRISAQNLAQGLERGRLETVLGAGHAVMTDNPSGFYSAFRSYVSAL